MTTIDRDKSLSFEHVIFAGERLVGASERQARAPRRRQPASVRSSASQGRLEALAPESLEFLSWLCGQRGLDVMRYRPGVLRRREAACLRAARARTPRQARQILEQDDQRLERALGALMIGVTSFFRDGPVFEALAGLLPALHSRAGGRGLRVLSVGCSDGSELYSVGMLLAEQGLLSGSRLVGVDCRADAIASAREGVYPGHAAASVDAGLASRYLQPEGRGTVRVCGQVRAACEWVVADAFSAGFSARADLVLCRNLVIYLNHAPARDLWASLAQRLPVGGILAVGKAERPSGVDGLSRVGPCLFRKLEKTEVLS